MKVVEILEYAHKNDIRLWADGDLLQVDAPGEVMTPEFRNNLKQHKPELIKTLTDTSETTRIVQENLRDGTPTLVEMGGVGRAYWVGDGNQCKQLQAELSAKGDATPVFSWGELVLIKDWPRKGKQNIYELKRRFQGCISRQ